MAYTDDAVLAKLSALNETQESIVTVAQWVMFHRYETKMNHPHGNMQLLILANRRHADRTGQLWLQRLKDSNSNKRLNLVYLANGTLSPLAIRDCKNRANCSYRGSTTIESPQERRLPDCILAGHRRSNSNCIQRSHE